MVGKNQACAARSSSRQLKGALRVILTCKMVFTYPLADWPTHKKYCKRLLFVKKGDLPAFVDSRKKANQNESEVFRAALQAAEAAGDNNSKGYVLMAPLAAQNFVKVCGWGVMHAGSGEQLIILEGRGGGAAHSVSYSHANQILGFITASHFLTADRISLSNSSVGDSNNCNCGDCGTQRHHVLHSVPLEGIDACM